MCLIGEVVLLPVWAVYKTHVDNVQSLKAVWCLAASKRNKCFLRIMTHLTAWSADLLSNTDFWTAAESWYTLQWQWPERAWKRTSGKWTVTAWLSLNSFLWCYDWLLLVFIWFYYVARIAKKHLHFFFVLPHIWEGI